MRANVPVNDENVTRPVIDDTPAIEKITKEQLELAKIGNSPDWKILKTYMESRIEVFTKGLFGEDLSGQDTSVIGQRFLAAQSVIAEFNSLIDQIEQHTEVVNEAAKQSE